MNSILKRIVRNWLQAASVYDIVHLTTALAYNERQHENDVRALMKRIDALEKQLMNQF